MKKSILILIIVVICMSMAVPSFAKTFSGKIGENEPVTTIIGGATFTPSTGVYVDVASIATAYCVTSLHASAIGNTAGKQYGSTSVDATIFSMSAGSLSAITTCETPTSGAPPELPSGGWE